jgi:signal transduction histidine kinase/CheY-like chemotaxis protein/Flp pilus assembly protein TadD
MSKKVNEIVSTALSRLSGYLLAAALLFLTVAGFAQQEKALLDARACIDSTLAALEERNAEAIGYFSLKGLLLIPAVEVDTVVGRLYRLRAKYHDTYGLGDSAVYYYKKAIEKLPREEAMEINSNIGLVYNRIQDFSKSVQHFELAMEQAIAEEDIGVQATVATNLGIVFDNLGRTQKARDYYLRAIALREQEGNKKRTLSSYYNLGLLELPVEESYQYFETGIALARELQSAFGIQMYLSLQSKLKGREGKYEEMLAIAEPLYRDSVLKGPVLEKIVLDDLVAAYVGLEMWEEAEREALELEKIGRRPQNFRALQNARRHLLTIYNATGAYEKYNEIAVQYYPAQDSLAEESARREIAYLDAELRDIEQEQQIELLNSTLKQKEIRRRWIITVTSGTAIVLFLLFYFRSRQVAAQRLLIKKEKETASQLAKVNQELKALDTMKSRFFANISHELRTPVTLIATPIAHTLERYQQSIQPEIKKILSLAKRNTEKLIQLIEELLELSRIENGKVELLKSPISLKPFFQQLISAYESTAAIKAIDLKLRYEMNEAEVVLLDKGRVSKIINNLLSNALKFTPRGGQVELSVSSSKNQNSSAGEAPDEGLLLQIKVADNGRGIPADEIGCIFERFYQAHHDQQSMEGGTGIGLALSRELALLMKGDLSATSEEGKGSTFFFTLPVEKTTEKRLSPQASLEVVRELLPDTTDQMRSDFSLPEHKLLIVEDNLDMQQLLRSILEEHYQCTVVNNGQEAWEMLQSNRFSVSDFDLILSDVMMPEMDGYTLLNHIKSHPEWRQLPMVLLTARAAEEDKLKGLRMGVDDYLAKPFSSVELMARIENLIANYEQRMELKMLGVELDLEAPPSSDATWLAELEAICLQALDKKIKINNEYLAVQMNISARQLLRRIKSLTGLSVNKYVQEVKLQKARNLLEHRAFSTVAEVAYDCGFNTPAYFSTVYEKRYGKRPIEYFSEE